MARRDAPPPLVEVTPWALRDLNGLSVSSETFKQQLIFFNVHTEPCNARCAASFESLKAVATRFSKKTDFYRLVTISTSQDKLVEIERHRNEAPNWLQLTGSTSDLKRVTEMQLGLRGVLLENGSLTERDENSFVTLSNAGIVYMLDQNGDLRIAVDNQSASLAGLVRAGLFLLEKGPN